MITTAKKLGVSAADVVKAARNSVAALKEEHGEVVAHALAAEAAQALACGDTEARAQALKKLPAAAIRLAGSISGGYNHGNNAGVVSPTSPLPEGMRESPKWEEGRQHLANLADKYKGVLAQNGLSFGVVRTFLTNRWPGGALGMVSPVVRVSASGYILIRMDKLYKATLCAKKGQLGLGTICKMTDNYFKEWVEGALAARAACAAAGAIRCALPAADDTGLTPRNGGGQGGEEVCPGMRRPNKRGQGKLQLQPQASRKEPKTHN